MLDELQYMYELQWFGVKPGLVVMERLMEALGYPEKKFKSVHIAGTNGKGSTAALLDSVLRKASYRTGLYTSPHLIRFNERIQINGQEISDEDLARLVKQIREVTEKNDIEATFFEFTTALAWLYFAEAGVDVAVIETGMGGRLDATNVISPMVSVITTIGFDHMEVLGNTLLKIATEKAGIIKEGVSVVVGETKPEIVRFFQEQSEAKHASLIEALPSLPASNVTSSLIKQTFTVRGVIVGEFSIPLLGRHQIDNACTALAALLELRKNDLIISDDALHEGLATVEWPGRMQIVSQKPLIIVDGAHNDDSVAALYAFIKNFPRHSVLVVAQKQGKDVSELTKLFVPLFDHVITTEGTYRPMFAEHLKGLMGRVHSRVEALPDTKKAVQRALTLLPADGMMVVTGSLYMIGGALAELQKE